MSAVPRLRRDIEAFPVEQDGRELVGVRDPAGYTPSVLVLSRPLLAVVALFDGKRSIADIQAEIMRQRGERIRPEQIEEIRSALDEHGFLDTPSYAERRRAVDAAFLAAPVRALRGAIDGFFAGPSGPGAIQWDAPPGPPVRGIIAPHIDFHRGGPAYAWAYRDLAERCDADCFVILGTCHAGMTDPFALTSKDYATPLGAATIDRDMVEAVARRAGQDCFASERAHRGEHSIEFQAVFLRHLFGDRRAFTIVPVLASFAHEALARGEGPEDDPRVPRFLEALGDSVAASGRRVAVIAGADLAHVGPRFGDRAPLTPDDLERVAREDRAMLAAVEAADPRGFFEAIAADGDRRRICGFSPIYALLRALGDTAGQVRHYGQWPDPRAAVTYASVVF
jgi:AmmeMemoRadiSam system protein B